MLNKMALRLYVVLLATVQLPITAWAADAGWFVEDSGDIVKPNESVNINPWNVATIGSDGQNGGVELVSVGGGVEIELSSPLYKLSDAYSDKIIQKDGLWGIERNVETVTFDGSEDWKEYKQPGYQNDNTVIFTCTAPKEYRIQNGISTHFDVLLDKDQKNCIYDGISFGREAGTILMRFMNVRGVKDTDSLKAYLKGQADSGRPVKLLYPALEATFTPFSENIQNELAVSEILGYRDGGALKLKQNEKPYLPKDIFKNETTGSNEMDAFLVGITSVRVPNDGGEYYIEGIYPKGDGLTIKAMDTQHNSYEGKLLYNDTDFLKSKATELILKGENGNVYIKINLSKSRIPNDEINGVGTEAAFRNDFTKAEEIVIPDYIPITENTAVPFYAENAVLYGDSKVIEIEGTENNEIDAKCTQLKLVSPAEEKNIEIVPVKDAGTKKFNALFLGDSLINQNYYTEAVKELFVDDSLKLTLLGTRGEGDNRHEGRGGWSAYDYCNENDKYGYTNPFLNEGLFDFKYYMESNNYKNVDMVILNLGINDLNLIGHNTHTEILGYFSQIIDKIHEFDPKIAILINMPTIPYENEVTSIYKNERLEFAKSLINKYSKEERQRIFLVPLYLSVGQGQGYKYSEPIIDEYNQDYGLVVKDTTHPSISGYEQMAQMTYNYMKYAAMIDK